MRQRATGFSIGRRVTTGMIGAALFALGVGTASANLVQATDVTVFGTGLGAVNTLVTAHDPGGPGNQNGTESGCVDFDSPTGGSATDFSCLLGLEGGDNTAINNTFLLSNVSGLSSAGNVALVVNISETGQDVSVTLTDLYFALYSTSGTLLDTFSYAGPDLVLTQGTGTGIGGSGFVFVLDSPQMAIANADCATLANCVLTGGVQFANGTTNDGSDTLHVISVTGPVICDPNVQECNPQSIPEPGVLPLAGFAMILLALVLSRRRGERQRS